MIRVGLAFLHDSRGEPVTQPSQSERHTLLAAGVSLCPKVN